MLHAMDGQEAVDTATAMLPDLILMDISLPVMDGWEATSALKRNPLTASIPVIALTAHALSTDRDKAMAAESPSPAAPRPRRSAHSADNTHNLQDIHPS